jgi:hypothetical protein
MYQITARQKKIAKFLKVDIYPSTNKNKKIDVYKNGYKIVSIGAAGYKDYSIFAGGMSTTAFLGALAS